MNPLDEIKQKFAALRESLENFKHQQEMKKLNKILANVDKYIQQAEQELAKQKPPEILHEQPKYSVDEMREKEKARRASESERFNLMTEKQAAATEATQAHRERMQQDIERRNSNLDKPENQSITDKATEIRAREAYAKQANDAFVKSVQARGVNEIDKAPGLNAEQQNEAQQRNFNAVGTIVEQHQRLMALVKPDDYKGSTHKDLKQEVSNLIKSAEFNAKLPTEQQVDLLKMLHSHQETVAARKEGFSKFLEGDYSKWLKSTISALESHKVVYDTTALTSMGTNVQKPAVTPVAAAPAANKPSIADEPPPPSLHTPPFKR